MRIETDERFWVVVDPEATSVLADVCFESSIRGLEAQFRGGLAISENPAIFTDRAEAERDAKRRLAARDVARVLVQETEVGVPPGGRLRILDAAGEVVFTYTAPGGGR